MSYKMFDKTAPIKAAVGFVGRRKIAERCGVTPEAVTNWQRRGVPAKAVIPIEEVTGGRVTRHDLRPDIFGPAPSEDEAA